MGVMRLRNKASRCLVRIRFVNLKRKVEKKNSHHQSKDRERKRG